MVKTNYTKEAIELKGLKSKIHELELVTKSWSLYEHERNERRSGFKRISELEKLDALDLKQKSQIKWAMDGDENTCSFHGYINNKNRKNHIDGLAIDGVWNTDSLIIKKEVFNFYQQKFFEK